MINAVGLQNPGIDRVIAEELPRLRSFFRKPVIANISGFSVEEYAYCCGRIDREEQVAIIEVNVSCPNVRHGGMSFGTSAEAAAEVTRAVKAVTTKPVFIKLVAQRYGHRLDRPGVRGGRCRRHLSDQHDAGHAYRPVRRRAVIANTMGGFSGPAIFPWPCAWSTRCPGPAGFPSWGAAA